MNESSIVAKWQGASSYFHSLLRIVSGFLMATFGSAILFGFPKSMGGPPQILSQMGIGGIIEFLGGLLVLFGFLTRPISFLLSGTMAVAYFQFHFRNSIWPTVNNGVDAAIFCFIFLYFSAAGCGPWGVDSMRKPNS